jgi:hypothetical protein
MREQEACQSLVLAYAVEIKAFADSGRSHGTARPLMLTYAAWSFRRQ